MPISGGRPPLISGEQAQLLSDVIRRHDRGNDGKSREQIYDTMQELNPELSRKQVNPVIP